MPTISEWARSSKFQCLVYGKFKIGKTAGAATFPRPNFIDFDGGIATIASAWWKKKFDIDPSGFQYQQFKERSVSNLGIPLGHNAFDDACRYFDLWMKADKRDQFDTWVIDSGTTLTEAAATKAIILLGGKDFGSKPLSLTHAQAQKTGLVVPKMQDFGAERSLVEQFIDMVRDSGKHFVLIAHEKELSDDNGTPTAVVPMFTGQSVERIPLKFDEVYRIIKDNTIVPGTATVADRRVIQTVPSGLVRCGSRNGVPDRTEWTWNAIQTALEANHTTDTK